jgi:small-conductance mechanosensitive channel
MRPMLRSFPLIALIILVLIGSIVFVPAQIVAATVDQPDASRHAAASTDAAAEPSSAADTQQLIDTLKDPTRRALLIKTLEDLRKAATTSPGTPAPGVAANPATNAAPTTTKPVVALEPDSLGAQLIARGTRLTDTISASVLLAVRAVADIPDLLRWLQDIIQDPAMLLAGAASAARFLCVILIAAAAEWLVWHLTHRLYRSLAVDARQQDQDVRRDEAEATAAPPSDVAAVGGAPRATLAEGWLLLLRLPIILMALTVDLLPPLAFLALATLTAGTPLAESSDVRAVIVAVADAYVIVRLVVAVARATFGAPAARLRLLPVSDEVARYLMIWVRRIAIVIVFGYAVTQLALFFGMDSDTRQGVLRLISLLVHVMLIVMVLQCRTTVAARLSGAGEGFFGTLRQRVASVWHVYAIIFIIGGWFIYAAEVRDGFDRLVRFMLLALVVGLLARVTDIVLVGALDRGLTVTRDDASRIALFETRAARYHRPLRFLLRAAIFLVALGALLQIDGLDIISWFNRGALGDRLAGTLVTLVVTLGVAVVVWEAIDVSVQVYMDRLSLEGAAIRAARLRTIMPLLRNTLLITLMVLIMLTVMSEIGVNIGPLLAGASIFGVAIGFGSQKLVQDFITGIFLLLENAMQVGDNVTAGGLSGTVEQLSIRTLRLRAGDGSVHLIPFSSVSTVTNSNRGLGNAAVSVTVDYEEDTDRVGAMLSEIATAMRGEDVFAKGMLSDLQLWGIDHVDGTTVTLAGQIVCTDSARWAVQREFNRRVKIAFQEQGIRMTPTISVTSLRHPLDVELQMPDAESRAAETTPPTDRAQARTPPCGTKAATGRSPGDGP